MQASPLTWLEPEDPFPPVHQAWGPETEMPGLLAAGGTLNAARLQQAYQECIFPWFSPGQPNLWWSPDPRMVLKVDDFRLHPSLRKTLRKFIRTENCEIRINHDFRQVMQHCAETARQGQHGTWIVDSIINAYCDLHLQGMAHSVETWIDEQLAGGLYCVALGKAVYGESMFAHRTDASKIALTALVGLCRFHGASQIDCQQATGHLASLGAREQDRAQFIQEAQRMQALPSMDWRFRPVYWDTLSLGL